MKTLKLQGDKLSDPKFQIDVLSQSNGMGMGLESFSSKLANLGLDPFIPNGLDVFQINVGKMCNQTCKHCHVDAGPDRTEIMTKETMQQCLDVLNKIDVIAVDLTGGAPELNPNFRWFVQELKKINKHVLVRCNLTIVLANERFQDLPQFFADNKIEVVSSLPYFTQNRTDRQRGNGVFEKSIKALQMLNEVGYGKENSDLKLNLVYNPAGAFLPGDQTELELQFKNELDCNFNIVFNDLYCITNLPVSRFLEYLIRTENYKDYMEKLVDSFNPSAAMNVMCRNTLSVGWDGNLYDCDFNQMLELKVDSSSKHITDFNLSNLNSRKIKTNQHCYGCTAGAGSSCGGAVV